MVSRALLSHAPCKGVPLRCLTAVCHGENLAVADLATLFYEWGWGQSFHFAHRYAGETFIQSIRRHEYYLASRLVSAHPLGESWHARALLYKGRRDSNMVTRRASLSGCQAAGWDEIAVKFEIYHHVYAFHHGCHVAGVCA